MQTLACSKGHSVITVFDANIWIAQLGLRSPLGAAARFYLKRTKAGLALPEVVRLELQPARRIEVVARAHAEEHVMGVGLAPDLFPATFSLARHAGWTAHVLEQAANNRLIRPDVRYVGPTERDLPA